MISRYDPGDAAICIILEGIFPPVATTHHVVNRTLELHPHFPRHPAFL